MPSPTKKRRLGAWSGLCALAVHLLIALAQAVPASAAVPNDGAFPTFLVTCVVYSENAPGDAKKGGEDPARTGRSDCPVCQTETLCASLLPVEAVEALFLPEAFRLALPSPSRVSLNGRKPNGSFPRGPPSAI